jgi:hypothetical protein
MSTCANSEIPDEQMKRTKKEKNICSQTSRVEKKEKKKKRAFLTETSGYHCSSNTPR